MKTMSNKVDHKYHSKPSTVLLTALTLAISSQSVHAQVELEEIIVYAQKRAQNLQEVPIAVTAFTGDTLQNAGLDELSDLERLTPNFSVAPSAATSATFASLTIRGQTAGFLTLNADQAVGIYIDGAPITRGTNIFSNLFDVESVEVLKGPQGTLYGKNTTGGAVKITTKAPVLGEFGGYAEATAGDFGRFDVEGALNIPLGEKAALRTAISSTSRDGFGTGSVTGQELADDNETAIRASLLLQPNDALSITINAGYQDVDEKGSILRQLTTVFGGAFSLESTDPDFFVGNDIAGSEPINFQTAETTNISASVSYDLGWGTAESITSYRDQEAFTSFESIPVTTILLGQDAELFAQEFRLSGLASNDRLFWQTGLFYADESGEDFDILAGFGQFEITSAVNETLAIFGQGSYDVNEKLTANFGIRYTDEHRELRDLEAGAPILFAEADFDDFSWSVGLDYKFNDNLFGYFSVSEGFRSGAIDQGTLSAIVEPENVLNYEVGIKTDFMDNRVRLNASAFYSDYTNIQRTGFDPDSLVGATIFVNAAEATLSGFEIELDVLATENLSFGGTIGILNAEYDNYLDGPLDRVDDSFRTPEEQFSAYLRYRRPISGDRSIGFNANYFYQGENDQTQVTTRVFSDDINIIDSYGLLNLQVDMTFGTENPLKLALFANNVTEEEYFSSGLTINIAGTALANRIVGEPRTVGVRLSKDF